MAIGWVASVFGQKWEFHSSLNINVLAVIAFYFPYRVYST